MTQTGCIACETDRWWAERYAAAHRSGDAGFEASREMSRRAEAILGSVADEKRVDGMTEEEIRADERRKIAMAVRRYFDDGPIVIDHGSDESASFRDLIFYIDATCMTGICEGWLDEGIERRTVWAYLELTPS